MEGKHPPREVITFRPRAARPRAGKGANPPPGRGGTRGTVTPGDPQPEGPPEQPNGREDVRRTAPRCVGSLRRDSPVRALVSAGAGLLRVVNPARVGPLLRYVPVQLPLPRACQAQVQQE